MLLVKQFLILFIASAALLTSACSPLGMITGAGATVGMGAAREGGLGVAYVDAKIQIAISDLWFRYNVEAFRKLDLTVNQGRVLITGVVQDPEHRVEAVRLAWQPEGVKQVINEIRVDESEGVTQYARDFWITTKIRGSLALAATVKSINYSIDTVNGTVYIMGVARSQQELDRVMEIARTTTDVRQVVSYVKMAPRDEEEDS